MKVDETIYKNYFYKKVLFLLFFGILSLMLLVSFGTFYIYFRYYMNALADSSLQNSAYVCSNLDNYLQDVTLTTDDMYIDSQIHQLLTHPDQGNQALFQKYYSRHKFSNPYFICQIDKKCRGTDCMDRWKRSFAKSFSFIVCDAPHQKCQCESTNWGSRRQHPQTERIRQLEQLCFLYHANLFNRRRRENRT